eukprot:188075_1
MQHLAASSDSSSSSSSDSDSDSDHECKPKANPIKTPSNSHISKMNRNATSSKPTPNINNTNTNPTSTRKRKLSNINMNSANNNNNSSNNNNMMSGPPKKRQRTSNLTINTHIDNDDKQSRKKKKSDKSKKKKRKKSSSPAKKPVDGVKIEELECIVCRELPHDKIYQCVNSHLLCASCYRRISESAQCLCPECRVRMSRSHASRNKLAENYLSAHLFECPNAERGCHDKIQFCYLLEHGKDECKYREVDCKFGILGCKWSGLAKDRSKHNKTCPIKKTDPKKILKLVSNLNHKNDEIQKKKEAEEHKYISIAKLFEIRARNIVCRDIRINAWNENTKKTETLNSNYFVAMKKRWQLQLKVEKVPNPKYQGRNDSFGEKLNKLFVRLQCMGSVRKRIPLEICILKGPDFGYKLQPIRFDAEMTKNKRDSKWIEMIPNNMLFNNEDVKNKFFTNYHTENKINLRIVLVDKRPNGPSDSFGGTHSDVNVHSDFDMNSDHDPVNTNSNNHNSNNNAYSSASSISDSPSYSSSDSAMYSDDDEGDEDDDIYSDLDDYSSSEDFF